MRILTLSQLSLAGSSGIAEAKIPLWWYDGSNTGLSGSNTGATSAGNWLLNDGNGFTNTATSPTQLFTLSSTWNTNVQFAFEATIASNAGTNTASVRLQDLSVGGGTGTGVTASQISTTSTTATIVRSGKFTLTPGHIIGVNAWMNTTSGTAWIYDASLIIFPS